MDSFLYEMTEGQERRWRRACALGDQAVALRKIVAEQIKARGAAVDCSGHLSAQAYHLRRIRDKFY
ncbi:MAG: hypothetical protein HY482_01305 [Candidatus Wildermuthbacteria bacterium]|nr:hypothetical protein [Candidatus Wildermuthbacteria bacterium]